MTREEHNATGRTDEVCTGTTPAEAAGDTDVQRLADGESFDSTQRKAALPTKLGIGVEGGFPMEDDCTSGDACPAALGRTFQYCLAVLPSLLKVPAGFSSPSSTTSTDGADLVELLHIQEAWEQELLKQIVFLPLDSPGVPEKIRRACDAVVEHRGSGAPTATTGAGGAVAWEEEVKVSKYAATLEQVQNPPSIGPTGWRCVDCGATTNLWLNLSDGHIGCGRKLYGVGGGCLDGSEGAAIRHYHATGEKYPLIVKLGTITPYSADVYSYAVDEDCSVIDPLLPEHLAHFGVHIQQLSKTEKSTNELAVDWNVHHEWSRATEADTHLRPCSGAGFVGLRNLGNSCYVNSVVQVLTSIPELREKYVSLFPVLLAALPIKGLTGGSSSTAGLISNDFLLQHSSLAMALHTDRYPLQDRRRKAAIIHQAKDTSGSLSSNRNNSDAIMQRAPQHVDDKNDDIFKKIAYLDADSVTPQLYKHVVGVQHAEFATLHQQDAEEFLSLLLQWLGSRDREARSRLQEAKRRLQHEQHKREIQSAVVAASGCTTSDITRAEKALESSTLERLFTFVVEQRIQCSATQQVRYSYTRQQVLALPVPMDPAIQERFEEQQQQLQEHQQRYKRHRVGGEELREDDAAEAEAAIHNKASLTSGSDKEADNTETTPPSLPTYNFSECVGAFVAPTLLTDYHSSATGKRGEALKQMRLASFPPYLVVHLKRFFADQHWQARKLYCPVLVPEDVNMENMRGTGLQEGEVALPEEDEGAASKRRRDEDLAASHNCSSATQFDEELLAQLMSMGFTENACKRACLAVQNSSPDACVEWIMAHLNDENLNHPLPSNESSSSATGATAGGKREVDTRIEAALPSLKSMGFTERQARAGLLAVTSASGDSSTIPAFCDRAVDWLLSHSEDLNTAVETVLREEELKKQLEQQENAADGAASEQVDPNMPPLQRALRGIDDGSGCYSLHAFVTHIGKNASCGHYVGHVKRGDKWILFNDEKVAEAVNPPVDLGFLLDKAVYSSCSCHQSVQRVTPPSAYDGEQLDGRYKVSAHTNFLPPVH
ncbi:ubiquitin carboxyl-terminal hydrolase 5-like [Ochotona princeps]|uniref:ubiquitin carboxyl-terminal hydrolase 5-like n=1 Tax=Ochotona princeps TaxID=9978 RepID=UPI002715532A|nr:ubiquitin carboxyl-terminal hydrolase 5-like [Ochotona princeps]